MRVRLAIYFLTPLSYVSSISLIVCMSCSFDFIFTDNGGNYTLLIIVN